MDPTVYKRGQRLKIELQQIVRNLMGEIFNCDPHTIDSDTTMASLEAWDSLQHLNLVLAMEETLNVRFTTEEVIKMTSFDEIVTVLEYHRTSTR